MAASGPAQSAFRPPSTGKFLPGFLLSGFLFALLGAILPTWGYHLTSDFTTVGHYFLSLTAGVIACSYAVRSLLPKRGVSFLLVFGCALACGALLFLALVSPPAPPLWRMAGLAVVGFATGLLNIGLFHAVSPLYHHDPAATVNLGGIFFGLGCLAAALLVAGTFYAYTVSSILVLVAVVPGFFAAMYARSSFSPGDLGHQPTVRQALHDLRSPAAVLFALLLFFQFGNEWSIAGWLPLFLIRRVGLSPETSLLLLALYWLSLLLGRLAAISVLPLVRHGRLLMGSALGAVSGCVILLFTDSLFGAFTGVLMVGGGFASIYPLVAEKIGRRFPYYHPGFFNGIFSFAMVGGMLAPWTLGYAASEWGISVVMGLPLLGTCMVFTLLLLIWIEARFIGE